MADILKYPYDLEANAMYKHYVSFQNVITKLGAQKAYGGSVHLPLPADALKTSYSQSYADTDLGAAGNIISNMDASTVNQATAAIKGGDLSKLKNVLQSVGADSATKTAIRAAVAGDLKKRVAGSIVGEGTTAAIQKKMGMIVNPYKAVIYQGPGGFRTFSFTFMMQPESDDEVKTIKKIVYFFKYHMHPGVSNLNFEASYDISTGQATTASTSKAAITSSAMLTYPDTFKIGLFPNEQEQAENKPTKNALFRIENCVLESCNIDYSTSGGAAFFDDDDGSPVTTSIALSFKETQLMTRNKIAQGY